MCGLRENVKKDDNCFPGTFIQNEKWWKKENISCIKKNPKQKKQTAIIFLLYEKNKNHNQNKKKNQFFPLIATDDFIFLGIFKKENLLVSSSTTISPSTPPLILNIPLFC